ncbi:N-acetyltransferase ESCO2-like [Mytilus edulis]|uniref:N-acetyltransferase ESCO2-like n=1 Tax=Mytilus edulis TaxID=6550 RepID=UPI0039EE98FE
MIMDTRQARKRRWTPSPEKRTARTSLDFTENTPPPIKRFRESSTESDDDSKFTVKSFYGGREKKSFPHSPGRRKAATKVLSKLEGEEEEEFLTLRKNVPGKILKTSSKVKKDVFKLSSTSSDSEPVQVLKDRTRNNRFNKISPKSSGKKSVPRKKKSSPKSAKKVTAANKKESKTPVTPVPAEVQNIINEQIPGRKFFKSKSPASASKAMGSVIISKGFNLKFLPKRRSLSSLPKLSPSNIIMKKSKVTEVFDDSPQRSTNQVKESIKDSFKEVDSSLDSGFDGKLSEPPSQCTPKKIMQIKTQSPARSPARSPRNKSVSNKSPGKIVNKSLSQTQQDSDITSLDGSADLFTDSTKTDDISETGSEISGPSVRKSNNFFSIFNGTPNTSPIVQAGPNKSLRKMSPRQSPRIRTRMDKESREQMVVDAGQKKFGAVQCEVCGMVYRHADPGDESTHEKFHQDLLSVLKFPGWKKERVVQEFSKDCSRIIMVVHDDPKYAVKKIEDINNIMGKEMGFPEASLASKSKYKAFLFISEDKKVDGCCIAEPVTQGYRVIPESQPSQSDNPQPGHRPWYCNSDPEPAAVGISRIWVFGQQRRTGVASKLLDAVRQWFQYGSYIEKSQVAFSDPTGDGKMFASKYTGMADFLVYKYG